jgi:hypothetical protein
MFDTTGRRVWGPEHERKLASEIRKERRRLQAILTAADDLLARSNPRLPARGYVPVLDDYDRRLGRYKVLHPQSKLFR